MFRQQYLCLDNKIYVYNEVLAQVVDNKIYV